MAIGDKIKNAGNGLNALLVLGFLGIVWLIIYGNLYGNWGFNDRTSSSYGNQTIALVYTGNTPAGADNRDNAVLTNVLVTNATSGQVVTQTGNYTLSGGAVVAAATGYYNNTNVNVSYTVTYDGSRTVDNNNLVKNLTGGTKTFFGFSNTIFTIMAIVILITILLVLLAVVLRISKTNGRKSNNGFNGNIG